MAAKAEEDEDEEEERGPIHAKVSMADDPSTPYTHLLVPAQGECRRTLKGNMVLYLPHSTNR